MRSLWLVLLGCAKSAPPPELPSNAASTDPATAPAPAATSTHSFTPTGNSLAPGPAGVCTVGGETIDEQTREPLAGVTIVLTNGTTNEPLITDEKGAFFVHRATVPETIHAYYLDIQIESPFSVSWCGQALRLEIDQRSVGTTDI